MRQPVEDFTQTLIQTALDVLQRLYLVLRQPLDEQRCHLLVAGVLKIVHAQAVQAALLQRAVEVVEIVRFLQE